jgi:hypothetical protein
VEVIARRDSAARVMARGYMLGDSAPLMGAHALEFGTLDRAVEARLLG